MNVNLNVFLIIYDKLYDKAVNNLTKEELECFSCYCTQKKVVKDITKLIPNQINEWELPWNNYELQTKQYYEYSSMVHLYNNQNLIERSTHIGLFHYDVIFNKNSINDIKSKLAKTPDTIFYQCKRPCNQLSLLKHELVNICNFMNERMNTKIDGHLIWNNNEWVSECLSIVPKHVMLKFAKFLNDYRDDIEYILKYNVWNIMNHCPHRLCGIVERLWGIYLISCGLPLKQLNVIHDWNSYTHHHMQMNGTGLATL